LCDLPESGGNACLGQLVGNFIKTFNACIVSKIEEVLLDAQGSLVSYPVMKLRPKIFYQITDMVKNLNRDAPSKLAIIGVMPVERLIFV